MSSAAGLTLRETTLEDLPAIAEMERGEPETILAASVEQHQDAFVQPGVLYRSLVVDGRLAGFLILVLDGDGFSIELRRIVVSRPGRGYGTAAILAVENIARGLGRERIWLDVFEDNGRARHVYNKCGYSVFGDTELNGRRLLLLEKLLEPASP